MTPTGIVVHFDETVQAFIILFDLDGESYAYQVALSDIVKADTEW